jgi:hypothetical protein
LRHDAADLGDDDDDCSEVDWGEDDDDWGEDEALPADEKEPEVGGEG